MREYVITTDNNADLPDSYMQEHGVGCTYLTYQMDGVAYSHENFQPTDVFYNAMRKGSLPTTAQVNPEQCTVMMEPYLKEGKDILHLAFSSGLSGTYNNSKIAADELMEKYPDRRIIVIDTLAASLGQGLLVHYACRMKEQGQDMDAVAAWVEEHKKNAIHLFTVSDLFHLHRGGRVSRTTAVVGTVLNIKPILHVDDEGRLVNIGKVRGRKKSVQELAVLMDDKLGSYKDSIDTIFISHGDCLSDAEYLRDEVAKKYPIKEVLINPISATIGAHSGPDTLALFFLGDHR